MIGLEVTVRCPFHDAPVEIVTVGDPEGDMSASVVRCTVCRSTFTVAAVITAETVRFGWPELEDYIVGCGVPRHQVPDCPYCINGQAGGCASVPTIALRCGVGADTAQSWKRRGLAEWKADEVATRLGVHPSQIWPDAWAALVANDIDEWDGVSA